MERYVKEDLIIPHNVSFYDLIKACEPWHLQVSWYDQKQSRTLWLKSNNFYRKLENWFNKWYIHSSILLLEPFMIFLFSPVKSLKNKQSQEKARGKSGPLFHFDVHEVLLFLSWNGDGDLQVITWHPKLRWFLGMYLMSPGETVGKHWVNYSAWALLGWPKPRDFPSPISQSSATHRWICLSMGEFSASK